MVNTSCSPLTDWRFSITVFVWQLLILYDPIYTDGISTIFHIMLLYNISYSVGKCWGFY